MPYGQWWWDKTVAHINTINIKFRYTYLSLCYCIFLVKCSHALQIRYWCFWREIFWYKLNPFIRSYDALALAQIYCTLFHSNPKFYTFHPIIMDHQMAVKWPLGGNRMIIWWSSNNYRMFIGCYRMIVKWTCNVEWPSYDHWMMIKGHRILIGWSSDHRWIIIE